MCTARDLRLTTLQFLGSVHWKWRATRRMASRRSATSSVCLMFLALSASRSSSPVRPREQWWPWPSPALSRLQGSAESTRGVRPDAPLSEPSPALGHLCRVLTKEQRRDARLLPLGPAADNLQAGKSGRRQPQAPGAQPSGWRPNTGDSEQSPSVQRPRRHLTRAASSDMASEAGSEAQKHIVSSNLGLSRWVPAETRQGQGGGSLHSCGLARPGPGC